MPDDIIREPSETLEDPVQQAPELATSSPALQARQYVIHDVAKPSAAPPLPGNGFIYSSHLKALTISGIVGLLLLAGAIMTVVKTSQHASQAEQPTKKASVLAPTDQTLTIRSLLQVTQDTTIQKNLKVTGDTSLQGNLSIQGNAIFTGTITGTNITGAAINISGNSSINGTLTVGSTVIASNFQGTFIGDGSRLSGIPKTCTDCVKLQSGSVTAQVGNVSIAGTLSGRKLNIKPVTDDAAALSIQDANGADVLSVDTTHHRIITGDLVPQTPGSLVAGSLSPGITFGTAVADSGWAYNDNDKWTVMGADGFMRLVYVNQDTSEAHYVRCETKDCTTSVNTVVETDTNNGFDSPALALDQQGNAYIAYIDYTSPNEWHLAHCLNQDCSQVTIQTVGVTGQYGYNGSVTVDGQNHADVIFDSYDSNNSPTIYSLRFIHCQNTDCSSHADTTLASSDSDNGGGYYETSALATAPDGFPRVAYVDEGPDSVIFVRCTSYDCATRTSNIVDNGNARYYLSLAVGTDGLAKIVYQASADSSLEYAACIDVACSTATLKELVHDDNNGGQGDIVLDANNIPRISEYDYPNDPNVTSRQLIYIACADVNCAQMTKKTLASNLDYSNSLAIGTDGLPIIAYFEDGNTVQSLKIASLNTFDAADIVVSAVQSNGNTIGSSSAPFGQVYAQGLNLQAASSSAALVINQTDVQGVDALGNAVNIGSGPLAVFQINGTTKAEFNEHGTFIVNSDGTADAADFQLNGQTHIRIDQNATLILQPVSGQTKDMQQWLGLDGSVIGGINAAGQLYVSTKDSNGYPVQLSVDTSGISMKQFGVTKVAGLDSDGNLQLGAVPLEQFNFGFRSLPVYAGSLLKADINGDSELDLISIGGNNSISIFLNKGDGTLASNTDYAVSGSHKYAAVGDVNGDGSLDIVVPNGFNHAVSVLLNNGNGTFASAVQYGVGSLSPLAVALGDVNHDGKLDIVAPSNVSSEGMAVLLNNGDGTFGNLATYPITGSSCMYGTVVSDFNGDGYGDVAIADACSNGKVHLLINDGSGVFNTQTDYSDYLGFYLATADINNDGKTDIVGTYNTMLLGNGDGTFSVDNLNSNGSLFANYGIDVEDINGDGKLDLIRAYSTAMSTQLNLGNGNFEQQVIIALPNAQFAESVKAINAGSGKFNYYMADGNAGKLLTAIVKAPPKLQVSSNDTTDNMVILAGSRGQIGDFLQVQDGQQNIITRIDSTGTIVAPGASIQNLKVTNLLSANGSYGLAGSWYNTNNYFYASLGYAPSFGALAAQTVDGPISYIDTRPAGVDSANYGVRWIGWVKADYTGTYTFYTNSDDGSKLYINDQLVVDNWFDQGMTERSGTVNLTAGQWYPIKIDYYQGGGSAGITVSWSEASVPKALIPRDHLRTTDPAVLSTNFNTIQIQSNLQFSGQIQATSSSAVGLIVQGAASQTADLQQWQDSNGNVLAKIDASGSLTVKQATFNGTLTVNGHVVTGNTSGSTTATLNGNAGSGGSPACTVSGSDTGGQITIKTGTSAWAAGVQCTINFASSYGSAPHPVLTPANNVDTSAVKPYVTSATGSFTVSFIAADTAQHTFTFNYFNAQ